MSIPSFYRFCAIVLWLQCVVNVGIAQSAGTGSAPEGRMANPKAPFVPYVTVAISKIEVTVHVEAGAWYQLEMSGDLEVWTEVGSPCLAQTAEVSQEFPVSEHGRFFRVLPLTHAPATVAGNFYNLTSTWGTGTLFLWVSGNGYTLEVPGASGGTGVYNAVRSGNSWTITLTEQGFKWNEISRITLNYSSAEAGTYTLEEPGTPTVTGSFSGSGPGVAAPSEIRRIDFNQAQSGVGPGTMRVDLTGRGSGTFVVSNGAVGTGLIR